jgi:hypothetical protein
MPAELALSAAADRRSIVRQGVIYREGNKVCPRLNGTVWFQFPMAP